MPAHDLVRAWLVLVALSTGTVLLAAIPGLNATYTVVGVLVLAGLKARVILSRYLGLAGSRFWMRAFGSVIWMFLLVSFGLYMFGSVAQA